MDVCQEYIISFCRRWGFCFFILLGMIYYIVSGYILFIDKMVGVILLLAPLLGTLVITLIWRLTYYYNKCYECYQGEKEIYNEIKENKKCNIVV
jgi:hypothetical protein